MELIKNLKKQLQEKLTIYVKNLLSQLNNKLGLSINFDEIPSLISLSNDGRWDVLAIFNRSGHGDWAITINDNTIKFGSVYWSCGKASFKEDDNFPIESINLDEILGTINHTLSSAFTFLTNLQLTINNFNPKQQVEIIINKKEG